MDKMVQLVSTGHHRLTLKLFLVLLRGRDKSTVLSPVTKYSILTDWAAVIRPDIYRVNGETIRLRRALRPRTFSVARFSQRIATRAVSFRHCDRRCYDSHCWFLNNRRDWTRSHGTRTEERSRTWCWTTERQAWAESVET